MVKFWRGWRRSLVALGILLNTSSWAECDRFVEWVSPPTEAYFIKHRVWPIPEADQELAARFIPRLFVHPDSWHPIDFRAYIDAAEIKHNEGKPVPPGLTVQGLAQLSRKEQCEFHLDAPEIRPVNPAPVYIQMFRDQKPGDPEETWTYFKYNVVFDWSGLAPEKSFFSGIGAFLTGAGERKWHRLDIHTSVVLAFDEKRDLRLMTLMQHNYNQTFLAGLDFSKGQSPKLAAAIDSNELYLDPEEDEMIKKRVVTFLDDWPYLIDEDRAVNLWAKDHIYGEKAGAHEVVLRPVFIEPGHILAAFPGLLAPRNRMLGMYVGRDGPPGFNFYSLPQAIAMPRLMALGFWREKDHEFLEFVEPRLKGFQETRWDEIIDYLEKRLMIYLKAQ